MTHSLESVADCEDFIAGCLFMGSDYIEAARVAQVPRRTVLSRLALKNAVLPALTVLGLTFAYSVSSAFLVETVFAWPGVGKYLTDAVVRVDYPVITSAALAVTVVYVLVTLVLDLVQARLDPRWSWADAPRFAAAWSPGVVAGPVVHGGRPHAQAPAAMNSANVKSAARH